MTGAAAEGAPAAATGALAANACDGGPAFAMGAGAMPASTGVLDERVFAIGRLAGTTDPETCPPLFVSARLLAPRPFCHLSPRTPGGPPQATIFW
jgi:hypothetical protein